MLKRVGEEMSLGYPDRLSISLFIFKTLATMEEKAKKKENQHVNFMSQTKRTVLQNH